MYHYIIEVIPKDRIDILPLTRHWCRRIKWK